MKLFNFVFIMFIALTNSVWAQVENNSEEINVFANVCEKMSNGESKSSARLRASDKASFKAVEEIPELREFRQYLDPHNFNIKIYKLVDNYLEDMNINVISQNSQEVCVEVSAYLLPSSISEVFGDVSVNDSSESQLDVEKENVEENVNITIPPKPEININEQIAYDIPNNVINDEEDEIVSTYEINIEPSKQETVKNKKISVFIDKTLFYNDTSTNGFFAHLEQEVLKKGDVEIQAKFDNPNYILKTKVLKAKVDNINSETGRLHIVVSIEITDTSNSETTTEHQNRFVLFSTSDDVQVKAAELVKNLLSEGMARILPKIKLSEETLVKNNMITPPAR